MQVVKPQKDTNQFADPSTTVGRLCIAYGVDSFPALAAAIGQGESTVKNWHYRGSIKLEHLLRAAADTKRSLDWLASGTEVLSAASESRKINQAGALVTGGDDGLQLVLRADERAPSWRTTPPNEGMAQNVSQPNPSLKGKKTGAPSGLLPFTGTSTARPLVLSLVNEAGITRDYHVIPAVLGGAGAGRSAQTSADPVAVDRAGDMAFSSEWLYRNLEHTSGDLATVRVVGDSMSPTLLDGESVVIDRGVREVVADAIYVVHLLGQRLVKRVQRKSDGALVIISDNPAYEREQVPRERARDIEVLGRVVWPRVR